MSSKAPFSMPSKHITIEVIDENGKPIQVAKINRTDYRKYFDPRHVSEAAIRSNMMGIYVSLPSKYERRAHA